MKEKEEKRGDGVCLYIDKTIKSLKLSNAVFNLSKIEQIWATVYFEKTSIWSVVSTELMILLT